jgi:hypothetical protein
VLARDEGRADMQEHRSTEITVRVNDLRELFREREFDPFTDEIDSVSSVARMAQLPHLVAKLKTVRLRILLPREQITPQTEVLARRAVQQYCAHMVAEARRKLAAMRWVGWRTFLVGLGFFGLSLASSAGVQRLLFLPEALRTLASEALVVAGWVIMWQPLDTLVQGWWPYWEEERTFKAIGAMPLSVHSVDSP